MHLTENYEIIDEHLGRSWEEHHKRLQPMTAAEIDGLRSWSAEEMARRIVRFEDLSWSAGALLDAALPGCGAQMAPAIGHGMSADRHHVAPIMNAHGFSIEWLKIPAGGRVSLHHLACQQVLICKSGTVEISVLQQENRAQSAIKNTVNGSHAGWDTYAMPAGAWRALRNVGEHDALLIVMTPGDGRKTVQWAPDVMQAAANAGFCLDANGYVALKRFVDRSQR